ncbi:hypothetical protein BHM03_00012922 [Ensete ventricosum]|nr:hypothetical protein BHM03_00012922 [Ensete ventricosum]
MIVDLIIIGSVGSSHHHVSCSRHDRVGLAITSTLPPSITLTASSTPSLPLRRRRLPCPPATAPVVGSALAGGTSTGATPLRTGRGQALPLLVACGNPYGRRFGSQVPPLRAAAPVGSHLQAASVCRPLRAGLSRSRPPPCGWPSRG